MHCVNKEINNQMQRQHNVNMSNTYIVLFFLFGPMVTGYNTQVALEDLDEGGIQSHVSGTNAKSFTS